MISSVVREVVGGDACGRGGGGVGIAGCWCCTCVVWVAVGVCVCAWWCVEVGVVCIVDCGDVEVGAVNVVCFDVGGGVVVVSIVSGGSWGSCGAV